MWEGVKGVGVQPVRAVRKRGFVVGAGVGVLKGAVGAVAKPACGVLDLVSCLCEVVKMTSGHFLDPSNNRKQRTPRVIYILRRFLMKNRLSMKMKGISKNMTKSMPRSQDL